MTDKQLTVTREQLLDKLIQGFRTQYGPRAAFWLSELPTRERIATGIEQLDRALGGGMPVGCIIEIFGGAGAGKTSIALSIAGNVNGLVVFIDGERKIEADHAKKFGATENFLILRPDYLEQAFDWTEKFLQIGAKLIVLDSLPSLIPKKALDEKNLEKQAGVALTAGFLSQKLGIFIGLCDRLNASLIVINQNRANFNMVNQYVDPYHQFGGHMLPSVASMRLRITRGADLKPEGKTYDPIGIYGQKLNWKISKSSIGPSQQIGEIPFVYSKGFVPHDELLAVKKELLQAVRAGTYAPVERDEVPPEVTVEEVAAVNESLDSMFSLEEESSL
jgi:recombination protein RecA